MRKTLAIAGVAGLLILGSSVAASASTESEYPVDAPTCVASPATIVVGAASTITCTFPDAESAPSNVVFYVAGAGVNAGTLSSLVRAGVDAETTIDKPVENGVTSVKFTGPTANDYIIELFYNENVGASVSTPITVTTASTGGGSTGGSGSLPATGSEFPATALWLGLGAVGIGGVAIAAAVARRRATGR